MNELLSLSIATLNHLLRTKEIKPYEVVEAYLNRIEQIDQKIGAVLYCNADWALKKAKELENVPNLNQPLWGIPIGVKDNIAHQGMPLSCASKILQGFVSPYTATVIKRLEEAGAILIARLNMDEFAMGSSTENSAFKICCNPWNLTCSPGGSSGGCSAAIAAGECAGAIGSDTGGSVRQPAAFCGLVGLKPTYGRVSRYGLVAYASSLDQIGPITRSVDDAAIILQTIAGPDRYDATCWNESVPDYLYLLTNPVPNFKIGIAKEIQGRELNRDIKILFEEAVKRLANSGHEIIEISLPNLDYALAAYYIIATAEASTNLARYDGVRYGLRIPGRTPEEMYCLTRGLGFGLEVKRRIILGTYVLSRGYYESYYLQALKVRRIVLDDFNRAFKEVDLILTPTTPTPAFGLGEKIKDPIQLYLQDIFTVPVNLAGICAVSVPCGFSSNGLPIGLQLIGPPLSEPKLLQSAKYLMEIMGWEAEGWVMPEKPPKNLKISEKVSCQ